MQKSALIPTYSLKERGRETFDIHHVIRDQKEFPLHKVHRDDNYLLIFQLAGKSTLMVDFNQITIEGKAIFCLLPGQIHYGVDAKLVDAWVIAIDSDCIQNSYRPTLMETADRHSPIAISHAQTKLFQQSLDLMDALNDGSDQGTEQVLRSMLDVCIGLFISVCQNNLNIQPESTLRPALITKQFRYLLLSSFRIMKSPADYAEALNISAPYLNEVVKATTGYPVSHWIHQEIILEAKRLLFYTDDNVKEIAMNLGYTDVPYFIRLFGKITSLSPLQFRKNYHK